MRVFMLGWEFPPFITGGLGTACFGLTKAMSRRGIEVIFAVPKAVRQDGPSHVTLLSPENAPGAITRIHVVPASEGPSGAHTLDAPFAGPGAPLAGPGAAVHPDLANVEFLPIPADFSHPYTSGGGEGSGAYRIGERPARDAGGPGGSAGGRPGAPGAARIETHVESMPAASTGASDYGGDLLQQVDRYARFCLAAARHLQFDIIHAHDWMTYPAGMLVARVTGKPLVTHIHSTEFDRSGEGANRFIADVERRGMHAAMRVIAVSQLTKNIVCRRYALRPGKVEVVYNGVDTEPSRVGMTGIRRKDKIVLYFGRITYQKGPEYFIRAAKRVLDFMDDVKFVVAGDGDMAAGMIELAAELGIGHKVLFTGFLRGKDIQRVFSIADLYVMPSVSEPFGIAPLEAMSHDVPVLISKTSGVSEVLTHALKVDFWNIDEMADKIIAVLRHPPLSRTLRSHGAFEVRRLTWDGAAERCDRVYQAVCHEMHAPALA